MLVLLLLWMLSWSMVLGRQSRVVTSCSYTEQTGWNEKHVAGHLKSWLVSLATIRSLSPHQNILS